MATLRWEGDSVQAPSLESDLGDCEEGGAGKGGTPEFIVGYGESEVLKAI